MQKKKIRIFSAAAAVCVILFAAYHSRGDIRAEKEFIFSSKKNDVNLWYSDDALTDYLLSRSVEFNDTHKKIRLVPKLVSAKEYLENIGKASTNEDEYPDLYILTNDALEKATLSGLTTPISDTDLFNADNFSKAALSSVSYDGEYVAYPYYFETSTLLYNKTYLENAAQDKVENEHLLAETTPDNAVSGSSLDENSKEFKEEVSKKEKEMLPQTMTDIIKFAESYNAPEGVEAIFKWDVSDIFYNYFIVGDCINIGGKSGDDVGKIDIYNKDSIKCMSLYQKLNQFFAIDSKTSSYESVKQDFIDGKMIFTLATTDVLSSIKKAQKEGKCKFEYGVLPMPSLTPDCKTRTMSVTQCIAVNGYSECEDKAKEVAQWLCTQTNDDLYKQADKVSCYKKVQHDEEKLDGFLAAYENSVPMPKMISTSNFWMQLEISFEKIWNGADPNETLKAVSEQIKTQVTGSKYTETYVETPENISFTNDEDDYYDEGMDG